jgi:hypothetical protein
MKKRLFALAGLTALMLAAKGVAAEPPEWFNNPLGSRELPFGYAVHSLRCDWSGVFEETDTWSNFEDAPKWGSTRVPKEMNLANQATLDRLKRAVAFFNELANVNPAFDRSHKENRPQDSVIFSSRRLSSDLWKATNTTKDTYETTSDFKRRRTEALNEVLSATVGTVSFAVGSTTTSGPNGLDHFVGQQRTRVFYDADRQSFNLGTYESHSSVLALSQREIDKTYDLKTYEVLSQTERVSGFVVRPSHAYWGGLSYNASPSSARSLHPKLVVVVTAKVPAKFDPEYGELITLEAVSIELRNVCSNETLASVGALSNL